MNSDSKSGRVKQLFQRIADIGRKIYIREYPILDEDGREIGRDVLLPKSGSLVSVKFKRNNENSELKDDLN